MDAFSLDFVSPASHQHLAVEISFSGQFLCQISKERDDKELEVEFFNDYRMLDEKVALKFTVREFLQVLNQACDALRAAQLP